jgi:hypothetical protein
MPTFTSRDFLEQRLGQEGGTLWTDTERRDLSERLVRNYRPDSKTPWEVRRDHQMGDTSRPVYLVVRGELKIHTDDREDRAQVVARALQALDRASISGPG